MAGKNHYESFSDYKKRLIDPISDSYCAAKWLNATIWLGNGQTTSCHHPLGHQIDAGELEQNPSAIHNTPHKKLMRKMMQEGTRPQECEYCWKIEDLGRNSISDRVYKTAVFDEEHIQATAKADWQDNTMLRTLEISFDRTCNFACSYCNPSFSTTWVKDINKFGPYRNINGDARSHFINKADHARPLPDDVNPYTQAFWRWWEQEDGLADNLEEIRITGGEPLMAPGVWKLFEWFRDNQERVKNRKDGKVMRYAINSNLVPKDDIMDRLIELSHFVPHLEVYTSAESMGQHSEYIRDGFVWDKWMHNLNRLHTEGNIKKTHIMMTINSLCLASIVEFMDEILAFKRKHNTHYPTMSLNILRFPSFQSCSMLPMEIRQKYSEKLQEWLNKQIELDERTTGGMPILMSIEREQTQRLIDYLDVIKTPHKNVKDPEQNKRDFKQFYSQYDIRRAKNFRETFPIEFVEWFDSIDTEVPTSAEVITGNYREGMDLVPEHPPEDPSKEEFINPDLL
jgi:sulfatase maturation enzyme AslB (radical SAM superfamily)